VPRLAEVDFTDTDTDTDSRWYVLLDMDFSSLLTS
jgi:hypothetical protein